MRAPIGGYSAPQLTPSRGGTRTFWILAASFLMATASCARGTRSTLPEDELQSDSAIIAATAQIIRDSVHGRLRIDPERIPIELDAVRRESVPSADSMRSGAGLSQLGDLFGVGVRVAGDSIRVGCGGAMVPNPVLRSCPTEPETIVVIGRPRADGPIIDSLASIGTVKVRALRTVRVINTQLDRHGRATAIEDYTIGLNQDHWVLVIRRTLLYIE